MGEVYRRTTSVSSDVAVKTLKGPFTERFEREARAISALNHPNICTLYDVGQHDGSGYLVMELHRGQGDRRRRCRSTGASRYGVADLRGAPGRAQERHRPPRPEAGNIMVTKQGVKLLDFGLAKLAAPGRRSCRPPRPRLPPSPR